MNVNHVVCSVNSSFHETQCKAGNKDETLSSFIHQFVVLNPAFEKHDELYFENFSELLASEWRIIDTQLKTSLPHVTTSQLIRKQYDFLARDRQLQTADKMNSFISYPLFARLFIRCKQRTSALFPPILEKLIQQADAKKCQTEVDRLLDLFLVSLKNPEISHWLSDSSLKEEQVLYLATYLNVYLYFKESIVPICPRLLFSPKHFCEYGRQFFELAGQNFSKKEQAQIKNISSQIQASLTILELIKLIHRMQQTSFEINWPLYNSHQQENRPIAHLEDALFKMEVVSQLPKEILKNKEFIESILTIDSFQELSHYLFFVKELFFLFDASYVDTVIQFAIKAKAIKQKIFKSTVKDFLKLFKTCTLKHELLNWFVYSQTLEEEKLKKSLLIFSKNFCQLTDAVLNSPCMQNLTSILELNYQLGCCALYLSKESIAIYHHLMSQGKNLKELAIEIANISKLLSNKDRFHLLLLSVDLPIERLQILKEELASHQTDQFVTNLRSIGPYRLFEFLLSRKKELQLPWTKKIFSLLKLKSEQVDLNPCWENLKKISLKTFCYFADRYHLQVLSFVAFSQCIDLIKNPKTKWEEIDGVVGLLGPYLGLHNTFDMTLRILDDMQEERAMKKLQKRFPNGLAHLQREEADQLFIQECHRINKGDFFNKSFILLLSQVLDDLAPLLVQRSTCNEPKSFHMKSHQNCDLIYLFFFKTPTLRKAWVDYLTEQFNDFFQFSPGNLFRTSFEIINRISLGEFYEITSLLKEFMGKSEQERKQDFYAIFDLFPLLLGIVREKQLHDKERKKAAIIQLLTSLRHIRFKIEDKVSFPASELMEMLTYSPSVKKLEKFAFGQSKKLENAIQRWQIEWEQSLLAPAKRYKSANSY